jgi:nicotinate-nucleotide adenylyltransferase
MRRESKMNPSRQAPAAGAIGLFGGTFDPVHFGHLRAALEASERLGLPSLRLLPAGDPPHRGDPVATATQRLAMLELAVASCPQLQVDDRELRRPGPSFMVDTLTDVRAEVGTTPVLLLIGQDAANALDGWHRWRDLFGLAHLVVLRRPDAHFSCTGELLQEIERRRTPVPGDLLQSPAGKILPLEVTQLDISSTLIRRLLAEGKSPQYLAPDSVLEYIRQQRLYGAI